METALYKNKCIIIIIIIIITTKLCLETELRQPSMKIISALRGRYTSCRRTSY